MLSEFDRLIRRINDAGRNTIMVGTRAYGQAVAVKNEAARRYSVAKSRAERAKYAILMENARVRNTLSAGKARVNAKVAGEKAAFRRANTIRSNRRPAEDLVKFKYRPL